MYLMGFPIAQLVQNPPAIRRPGFHPGLGSSPGGGHGNPLRYSCLENPMNRGAGRATVYGVTKSRTRLSDKKYITPLLRLARGHSPSPF